MPNLWAFFQCHSEPAAAGEEPAFFPSLKSRSLDCALPPSGIAPLGMTAIAGVTSNYCTAIVTVFDVAPPMLITRFTAAPVGALSGTCTFT